ncbi:MAG: hypothetical protein IJK62_12895 [Bacteroidales bacterium]|nr:hypothetical protein [Bacteroidales bacterium]
MKKFLLLAMCALVSGLALGQHNYYSYFVADSITTVVPISSGNSLNTYLVSVNKMKNEIAVATLTGNCPQALVYDTIIELQLYAGGVYSNIGSLVLNGGFVDYNDNIFVYGAYCNGTNRQGTIVKINNYAGNFVSANYLMTTAEIISGCTDGSNCYFATSNTFFKTDNALTNLGAAYRRNVNNALDISLAYDGFSGKLIVSGCTSDNSIFLLRYSGSSTFVQSGQPELNIKYTLPTGYYYDSPTNALCLGGNGYYCDSIAYITQAVESLYGSNVWLLKVNYLNGNVITSNKYAYDNANYKISVLATANNFDYLFIVGDDMSRGKYVGQFDLYNLNNSTFMTVYNSCGFAGLQGIWQNRDLTLNNMTYDHYTGNIIAGGACSGEGRIMEAYELADSCGSPITSSCTTMSYTTGTVTLRPGTMVFSNSTYKDDYRKRYYDFEETCYDCGYRTIEDKRSHIMDIIESNQQLESKNIKNRNIASKSECDIIMEGNNFTCVGFSGVCHYRLVDISGKTISEGNIMPNCSNMIENKKTGFYILQVVDSDGNTISRKFFISE